MVFVITLALIGQASGMFSTGDSNQNPIENPLGEMEDPLGSEPESENDREMDDDNIFDERRLDLGLGVNSNGAIDPWALSHESPFDKLTSPPPKG